MATALLWEQGTCGIEVRRAPKGEVALLAYFREAPGLRTTLASALAPLPRARLRKTTVPRVDWLIKFRRGFRPFRAAGFLIVPSWETADASVPEADLLIVDPGRAFGTGTHETTRLCLGLLRELARRGGLGRVLDLGAGSGILSVAAARLGARAVTAVDVDPEACASARVHATLNDVPVRVVQGDLASSLRAGAFDLVLANLIAGLLVERRDEIAALAAKTLVLSGLIAAEVDEVRAAYAGVGRVDVRQDGEWAALLVEAGSR